MSMELFVVSDRRLRSIAEWQRAIHAEGFPLRLSNDTPFEELDGILPVLLGNKQTDFECVHWSIRDLLDDYADIDFGHRWTHALSFRWGGDIYACVAAYMAAAAYATATDGAMLDCEEGKLVSPTEAVQIARETEQRFLRWKRSFGLSRTISSLRASA